MVIDRRSPPAEHDRRALAEWFSKSRQRSRELFDLLAPDVYYTRPISLRNPVVFYEGHLPAFNVNTILRRGLGQAGLDPPLDLLFARGIDPADETGVTNKDQQWPTRDEVRAYADTADRAILDFIERGDIDVSGHPILDRAEGLYAIIEHEAMHQETLLYIWHQVPYEQKIPDPSRRPIIGGDPPAPQSVRIAPGRATLGSGRHEIPFGWDNEFPEHTEMVDGFSIDRYNVTNQSFLAFVEAGGYRQRDLWSSDAWQWLMAEQVTHPSFWRRLNGGWVWRGLFEEIPLPLAWPVYVTYAEAEAYARWRRGRLPTEAEYHRATYGTPSGEEHSQPWGEEVPADARGNFDFQHWEPVPIGSFPAGRSAWGVEDLVGNGWEWTATVFDGFPGFKPMPSYPEYSADFFDGLHYVMKGGSPGTARELVRRSFRNWFRPCYPYVYATFRCVDAEVVG